MKRTIILFWVLGLCSKIFACTDFLINTSSGNYINGRSLEFATTMQTELQVVPRGESLQSIAPNNCAGLKWTSKYSYMGVSCIAADNIVDGMNEKGLTVGALWMPGSIYQKVPANQNQNAIAVEFFGKWVLGNFATVDEVACALQNVYVWEGVPLPQVNTPPLHFSIHDAQGNSIVVEFTCGQQRIYENSVQVLTNYPAFDWQVTNLQNYVAINPKNSQPFQFTNGKIAFQGQGSGLLGLPGDPMPPSRFVRIFYLKNFAQTPTSIPAGVNLAFHLLNTVDIPKGTVVEGSSSSQNLDYTQWVVVKDLTNQVLFFRTYQNQNIYRVDLKQALQSGQTKCSSAPLSQPMSYLDAKSLF